MGRGPPGKDLALENVEHTGPAIIASMSPAAHARRRDSYVESKDKSLPKSEAPGAASMSTSVASHPMSRRMAAMPSGLSVGPENRCTAAGLTLGND